MRTQKLAGKDSVVHENRVAKAAQTAGKLAMAVNLGALVRLARFGVGDLRQRLRDTYEVLDPFESRDRVTRLPSSHDIDIMVRSYCTGQGVEIGPGSNPYCPPDRTIFADKFEHSGMNARIIENAWQLPFADNQFDFVMSSHLLEHCPDTLRTLLEWRRVLRPGGRIVLVLPHGGRIFDAGRPFTTLAHHIEDYDNKVDLSDPAPWHEFEHISMTAVHHFWVDNPLATLPNGEWNWQWIYENGLIHYHVWRAQEMAKLLEFIGCRVLFSREEMAQRRDSFAIVGEVP